MNPAGYLYKRIVAATEVISNPDVRDIYSVAGCISEDFLDYEPCPDFETNIVEPVNEKREGFDVVSYSTGSSPECSPLSCNDLCEAIRVNAHCLFATLEDAKRALEGGLFVGGERGPYRIIEVCSP